jgi:thioredoxin 1
MVAPIIEELAKEYQGRLKIGKLNVEENSKTATHYGIMSVPTLIFFKKGRIIEQVVGVLGKAELKKKIEENLSEDITYGAKRT